MSKLQENMRRFRTKNLQEQALYKTMADLYKALKSGQVDAAGMAEILKRADAPVYINYYNRNRIRK
jgi:hypothetical protein